MSGDNAWGTTKEQLESIFNDIPAGKCMARRTGTEQGPMLYSGDGYVTAWFMYWRREIRMRVSSEKMRKSCEPPHLIVFDNIDGASP